MYIFVVFKTMRSPSAVIQIPLHLKNQKEKCAKFRQKIDLTTLFHVAHNSATLWLLKHLNKLHIRQA